MRISQQIGWSQESKLIYQIVQQTEKLNNQFTTGQPGFKVPVSKQIGWSNESNLYYEWLRSLSKLTSHYANCCGPVYYYAANVCYSISGVIVKSHVELSIGDVVLTSDGYCYAINGINPGPGYNVTYVSHQTCFVSPCQTTTTTTTVP
jgi:hypothetical protein